MEVALFLSMANYSILRDVLMSSKMTGSSALFRTKLFKMISEELS